MHLVMSSSSSSRAAMAVGPTDRPSVQLWLPESFNSMLADLTAQEDDETQRGAFGSLLEWSTLANKHFTCTGFPGGTE